MEIVGYKCFDKGLINSYGKKFEVGKIYIATGKIKPGTSGNGFHLCKNIEDTFKYLKAIENEVDVCKVKGSGVIEEYSDEYYGYYDMYCVEKLEVLEQLNRLQIIEQGLNLNEFRAERFVSTYKLFPCEIEMFKDKFKDYSNVLRAISYHQEGDTEVYKKLILKK